MMKKIIKTMLAFAALMLCGGAWAAEQLTWEASPLDVPNDTIVFRGITLNELKTKTISAIMGKGANTGDSIGARRPALGVVTTDTTGDYKIQFQIVDGGYLKYATAKFVEAEDNGETVIKATQLYDGGTGFYNVSYDASVPQYGIWQNRTQSNAYPITRLTVSESYEATISSATATMSNLLADMTRSQDSVLSINVSQSSTLTVDQDCYFRRIDIDIPDNITLTLARSNSKVASSAFVNITGGGTLKIPARTTDYFGNAVVKVGSSITVEISDTGTSGNSSAQDGLLIGDGTVKYSGGEWHLFNANSYPAKTLTIELANTSGVIIPNVGVNNYVNIGSLSGSKGFRTDYGSSGNNETRNLRVVQSKNTTWSGNFKEGSSTADRLKALEVCGAADATEKTLTLGGDYSGSDNTLVVDASGSVKLTGSWKGNVTINGEFGGSGSVTDATTITLAAGAKIRADWSGNNGPVTVNVAPTFEQNAVINVMCEEVPSGTNKVKLFSGTFTAASTTATAKISTSSAMSYVASVAIESDGVYAIIDESLAMAKVGDSCYLTLAEAISAVEGEGTIKLLKTTSESVQIPANVIVETAVNMTGTVTGSGKILIKGEGTSSTSKAVPTIAGLSNSSEWTGTLEIADWFNQVTIIKPSDYGNANSTFVFNGFKGYIHYQGAPYVFKAIEFKGEGFEGTGRYGAAPEISLKAETISGDGMIKVGIGSDGGGNFKLIGTTSVNLTGALTSTAQYRIVLTKDASETLTSHANQTIFIGKDITIADAKKLTASNGLTGSGTVIYDAECTATLPTFTLANTWTGLVTIKNFGTIGGDPRNQDVTWTNLSDLFNKIGNKVKFVGVCGYITGDKSSVDLILENGTGNRKYGWRNDNGSSSGSATFKSISGSGKFMDTFTCSQSMLFKDASNFTGTIAAVSGGKKYTLGADTLHSGAQNGTIYIDGKVKGGANFDGATVIANGITIDLTDGPIIAKSVTFGSTLNLSGSTLDIGTPIVNVATFTGTLPSVGDDHELEFSQGAIRIAHEAVTAMTATQLNESGVMRIKENATLTVDTDITGTPEIINASGSAVTLTLAVSGDKKYVSAADVAKLQLGSNVKLDYGWTAHKVISVNYVWKSGTTILAKMAEGDGVETVDGTLGGLVKRSTWNDIVIDQSNSYATDSANITKMAVDGTTVSEISGVTATRYSRGSYRTKNGNSPLTTTMPFMNGYLDDHNAEAAVSITVDGIPFKTYDVIVYFQTDGSAHPTLQIVQGEVTKNYRYNDAMELKEVGDTGTWGIGNYDGFSYVANVMRVTNLTGNTVKVTTNKASGERSSIAAIQIVQMSTDVEDNALASITVGETTNYYTSLPDAITAAKSGQTIKLLKNVSLASTTTIPTGSNLEILKDVELDVNGQTFNGSITGAGKIIYTDFGNVQGTVKTALHANTWTGTLVIDGASNKSNLNSGSVGNSSNGYRTLLNNFGNEGSSIELLNCTYSGDGNGNNYFGLTLDNNDGTVNEDTVVKPELIITGELKLRNGFSQRDDTKHYRTEFRKLSGTGTILCPRTDMYPLLYFRDASKFRGSFNSNGYKFIVGERDADGDGLVTNGTLTIKPGKEMTLAKDANWSLSNGVTVDGTLTFQAPDTAATKVYSLALKGTGTLVTKAVSESTQMKYILNNHANFRGSITTETGAHVMLANQGTTTTGLGFGSSGYICVESGSATIAEGATWTGSNGGVYVASGASLNVGGGSIVGKLYMVNGTTLNYTAYNTLTVSGNIEPTSATINVTLPSDRPTGDFPKTLLTWNGTLSSGVNFACTNIPDGFLLVVKDDGLYLEAQADIKTSEAKVANNVATAGYISVGQNGVYTITGNGGLTIDTLKLKNGSKIVFDPVRNPILANALTIESGATIKLVSGRTDHTDEYEKITCGLFRLFSYPNTIELNTSGITIEGLDSKVSKTLKTIAVEGTNYKQLVLDVGDYEHNGKVLKITQFGDSITEGIWRNGYVGTPNYRIPLMHRLETHGYKPMTTGFRGDTLKNNGTAWGSSDANGVRADPNYRLHNGVSAQRVYTGYASRAGFLEGIEAYLEASGDEQDVITLKIGTNDINGGETAANVYEGWVKLVNRLIKLRPQTRIVVTSILELANGNNTAGGTYSEMIEKAVKGDEETGTKPIFPANTVFYVDCRSASPQGATPQNFLASYPGGNDYVHPNWTGYNKMADQWVEGVMKAAEASTKKTYKPHLTTGAAANVPAAYRKGFVKLATMDFSQIQKKGSAWGASPYTAFNSAMADKKLSKVAYYVERSTDSSANTQFVWADMDSWAASDSAKNLNGMGVPTETQNNVIVENLHIYSNLDEIEQVEPTKSGVKGTLLFTNKGLGEATTDRTASGIPNSKYGFDWNDTLANNVDWGAMVLSRVFTNEERSWDDDHRWAVGQTLFSYNTFNNSSRKNVFGIGDFAVHCLQESGNSGLNNAGYNLTLNWVNTGPEFTYMTADKLDYGVIEIWGVPEGYVVPDSDESVEVTADTEDAAIEAAQIIPDTDADTAAGSAVTRTGYLTFKATRVGESNNWKVQAVVDNTKLPANKKIDDTAVAFANAGGIVKLAGATEMQTIQIPAASVTPGLYYSVSFGTTPDNHTQESERVLATSGEGTVDIPVPVLGNEKVYYIKVKASATK